MKNKIIKLLGGYTKKEVIDIRSYYRGMLKAEPKKEFIYLVHKYMYSLPYSKERNELWNRLWNRLHEIEVNSQTGGEQG